MIRRVLSACCPIGNYDPTCVGSHRVNSPWPFPSFKMDCSKSAPSTKRSGETGSPCLTPLLHLNTLLPGTPLSSTKDVLMVVIIVIQFIHLSPIPLALSMSKMT